MKTEERAALPIAILLACEAAVSLAAWAFEEAAGLTAVLEEYAGYASMACLALDSLILGTGLAMLALRPRSPGIPSPFTEIASSLPVIVFSSSPVLYAWLEGAGILLPAFLFAARSLRILRLRRILPGTNGAVLGTLAVCEVLRSLAGSFLPDSVRYSAALRILLVPEAMLLLGAALSASTGLFPGRRERARGRGKKEPQVGEEELAGLLGKKGSW